jgi:hypothetical protein
MFFRNVGLSPTCAALPPRRHYCSVRRVPQRITECAGCPVNCRSLGTAALNISLWLNFNYVLRSTVWYINLLRIHVFVSISIYRQFVLARNMSVGVPIACYVACHLLRSSAVFCFIKLSGDRLFSEVPLPKLGNCLFK